MKGRIIAEAVQLGGERGGDGDVALRRAELFQGFAARIEFPDGLQERGLALGDGLPGRLMKFRACDG